MMKIHSNTYKIFDIIIVPFPFSDIYKSKFRPAVIISSPKSYDRFSGHTIAAMITSAQHIPWPFDIPITNPKSCGLEKSCLIRFKLFTLDLRVIKQKIGVLSEMDRENLSRAIKNIFNEHYI